MSQFNLTLKPAQSEIILKPGASFTQAYEITNNSSQDIRLSASVLPWLPSDNQGHVTYSNLPQSDLFFSLLNSDLKLNQDFLLHPNQKKQLVLKVSSQNTLEKDVYLTFFVTQKSLDSSALGGQNLAQLGSHLLISLNQQENISSNLNLSSLSLTPKIKDTFLPLKINGEIYNPNNFFTRINGQIIIFRNGQELSRQNLYPYTVLAQSSRTLSCFDSNNNPHLCSLSTPIWPGRYQIKLFLNNSTEAQATLNFLVLPYFLILFIIFAFIALFLTLKSKQNISSKHI